MSTARCKLHTKAHKQDDPGKVVTLSPRHLFLQFSKDLCRMKKCPRVDEKAHEHRGGSVQKVKLNAMKTLVLSWLPSEADVGRRGT